MPFGDNDWLALTQEPILEPEIPICDPHHHFWDMRPERIPYQRYLLHELNQDIYSGHKRAQADHSVTTCARLFPGNVPTGVIATPEDTQI